MSTSTLNNAFLLFSLSLALFCLPKISFALSVKQLNLSLTETQWSSAGATWWGLRIWNIVSSVPFASMIAAAGPSLYKSGKECGACYQVKCMDHPSCSGKPARVVITDSCPGGSCASDAAHFDLSGTAFGAMAIKGQEDDLRNAGSLTIQYARVECDYAGNTVAFHVDAGSNSNYFSVVVEFLEGDGDLAGVSLQESTKSTNSYDWREMQQSWGADWKLDAGSTLNAPFSIRLKSQYSGQQLVARNVIPAGWEPGATYRSLVNYL
ncbi:hypothetical protein GIB67_015601 [Kingdonia uniflora]|uniref:Uncharacterized protein n=1 Tax=Kingdonia uniflora TaxID=39325 RepID=A0A7J7LU39_9MAGN|nr:hypothetical protein GIB67_015601 [Kingdonia uniflora]